MENHELPFYYGASIEIQKRAAELRKNCTETENLLWQRLKGKKVLGLKFRRQHCISNFIADFYCHQYKLVIEVDGSIHNTSYNKERDIERDKIMNELGLSIIRLKNTEILDNLDNAILKIVDFIKKVKK